MANYLHCHDLIYYQVMHIRVLRVWMLTLTWFTDCHCHFITGFNDSGWEIRESSQPLDLNSTSVQGIDVSLCLSLTPKLRVDVALFTSLTKRILYTGNACECKSPLSNVGKFIYFHEHSWFALCKATERGRAAESNSWLYIVAWDKVGTQRAGSSV